MIPGLGGGDPNLAYNNAIPLLMNKYLPNGMLGIALTGLMASFMAGVAANVSRVQHGGHDRPHRALHPPRPSRTSGTCASAAIATIGGIVVGDRHGADRLDVRQPHELPAGAVLDLQRAAVRHVHHRHVLEADDAGGRPVGPGGGHDRRRRCTYIGYKAGWFTFGSDLDESMLGRGRWRSWSTRSSPSS